MSFLPITKKDYNTAVLMTDFIAKMRDSLESNNTLKFTPLINGYKIDFVVNDNKINLLLDFNKKKKTEMIVKVKKLYTIISVYLIFISRQYCFLFFYRVP